MKRFVAVIFVIAILALGCWLFFGHRGTAQHTTTTKPGKPSPTQQAGQTHNNFDKQRYSLTNPTSQWVIVNKHNPLNPKNYVPADLTSVGNGQFMRAAAASALKAMIAGAQKAGLNLYAASAYRSYDTQIAAYNSEVKAYGKAYADQESARPGFSEHQSGWAVDLGTGKCAIANCFATTAAGKWVVSHAANYGFILRYPKDKEAITGYEWESWHYRYVGTYLAQQMQKTGTTTLEQFFGLPAAPTYQ